MFLMRDRNSGGAGSGSDLADFAQNVEAYQKQREQLLEDGYEGKFVAFYRGQLVMADSDKTTLISGVRKEFGNIRAYIKKVSRYEPTIRLPTVRRIGSRFG